MLGLAGLYQQTGQLAKAQEFLREKCQAVPGNYELRERLGNVQLAIYDEACARVRPAAEKGDSAAGARLPDIQRRKREFAVKEYKWRLQQHPTDRELHLHLGRYYYEGGSYSEAIAAFQASSQDARFEVESRHMLGLCFLQKKQFDLALEQFESAIKRHPEMDDEGKALRYDQALALEAMGRPDEALALYKRIYSQDIMFRDVAGKVEAAGS